MPSMHIPEDAWASLLVKHDGDTDAAREEVKAAVWEAAEEADNE